MSLGVRSTRVASSSSNEELSNDGSGGAKRIVVVAPETHAGRFHVLADEVTLGRAAGCEVTIDDTYASQMHARIFRRDGEVFVEDLGSTNGSYVNREKVNRPTVINPGDQLQIGATIFEVST